MQEHLAPADAGGGLSEGGVGGGESVAYAVPGQAGGGGDVSGVLSAPVAAGTTGSAVAASDAVMGTVAASDAVMGSVHAGEPGSASSGPVPDAHSAAAAAAQDSQAGVQAAAPAPAALGMGQPVTGPTADFGGPQEAEAALAPHHTGPAAAAASGQEMSHESHSAPAAAQQQQHAMTASAPAGQAAGEAAGQVAGQPYGVQTPYAFGAGQAAGLPYAGGPFSGFSGFQMNPMLYAQSMQGMQRGGRGYAMPAYGFAPGYGYFGAQQQHPYAMGQQPYGMWPGGQNLSMPGGQNPAMPGGQNPAMPGAQNPSMPGGQNVSTMPPNPVAYVAGSSAAPVAGPPRQAGRPDGGGIPGQASDIDQALLTDPSLAVSHFSTGSPKKRKKKDKKGKKAKKRRMEQKMEAPPSYVIPMERREDACQFCGRQDRVAAMLLCDGCESEWHMNCLPKVISHIPPGRWFCPRCVEDGTEAKVRAAPAKPRQRTQRRSVDRDASYVQPKNSHLLTQPKPPRAPAASRAGSKSLSGKLAAAASSAGVTPMPSTHNAGGALQRSAMDSADSVDRKQLADPKGVTPKTGGSMVDGVPKKSRKPSRMAAKQSAMPSKKGAARSRNGLKASTASASARRPGSELSSSSGEASVSVAAESTESAPPEAVSALCSTVPSNPQREESKQQYDLPDTRKEEPEPEIMPKLESGPRPDSPDEESMRGSEPARQASGEDVLDDSGTVTGGEESADSRRGASGQGLADSGPAPSADGLTESGTAPSADGLAESGTAPSVDALAEPGPTPSEDGFADSGAGSSEESSSEEESAYSGPKSTERPGLKEGGTAIAKASAAKRRGARGASSSALVPPRASRRSMAKSREDILNEIEQLVIVALNALGRARVVAISKWILVNNVVDPGAFPDREELDDKVQDVIDLDSALYSQIGDGVYKIRVKGNGALHRGAI